MQYSGISKESQLLNASTREKADYKENAGKNRQGYKKTSGSQIVNDSE